MPKVAILTPTYNRGHNGLLLKTMRSVSGQSCRDFVYLVVDHGSTDGTEEIVRGYGDPRVVYERIGRGPAPRYSSSVANNHGIRMLEEDRRFDGVEYVAFVHSDDMLPRTSVEDRLGAFDNINTKVVYGRTGICNAGMELIMVFGGPVLGDPGKMAQKMKKSRYVAFPHHSLMLDRNVLGGVKFDEELYALEDLDFSINVMEHLKEGQTAQVPEVVYYYRVHGDNITTQCGDLSDSDIMRYLDIKHGRTHLDAMVDETRRFMRRPHAFLPKIVKAHLRPVRNALMKKGNGLVGVSTDPYVMEIENTPLTPEFHG
ncbi:MAG: glycosyltransferase [Candidatus Aenigmarchaeota archaeon]|nr:glycosyltransferase [Candidatus Aenigmarchaeota archaeon]